MTVEQIFEKIWQEYHFLWEKPMLVSVSGGVDSVVLLHLLVTSGSQLTVFHCNFQLRAEQSDQDEQFVRELCKKYGVQCIVERFDTTAFAKKHSYSIQEAARLLRLKKTYEYLDAYAFGCAALAHHLDDNIETVLFHFFRGTGLKGLKGMDIYAERLFRPLLNVPKRLIVEYAQYNQLAYREDISNLNVKYKRNAIRLHIIPAITKHFPDFEKVMSENIWRFRQQWISFEHSVKQIEQQIYSQHKFYRKYNISYLSVQPAADAILFSILEKFGFRHTQILAMLKNVANTETTTYRTKTHTGWLKDGVLVVADNNFEALPYPHIEINVLEDFFREPASKYIMAKILKPEEVHFDEATRYDAFLDVDKLPFPLVIRAWQSGDVIQPLGMKGKKSMSKFLKDLRFSYVEKKSVLVLAYKNTVVWAIGQRIGQQFAVHEKSSRILWLHVVCNFFE